MVNELPHFKTTIEDPYYISDAVVECFLGELFVMKRGIVAGVETEKSLTDLNYANIEKWIQSSRIAKAFLFTKDAPYKLYTRSEESYEVPDGPYSATFYNGGDMETVNVVRR
ncbi:unnamed protein product [Trichobilharzia regenti]|nr:unnamed protein product [Trichobilharzia regenti]